MVNISSYFRSFHDASVALAVGSSCYLGMKALGNKKYTYAPHLGKTLIATSALASLYFAGFFEKDGFFNRYVGLGIPIPGMGGMKISLETENIKNLYGNISQLTTDFFKRRIL